MTAPVDLDRLVLAGEAAGEDEEDTRLLAEGLEQARRYVESFPWCELVVRHWLGDGVGGVFTVSLAEIEPARDDVDRWLWLVVGDLPPLYLTAVDLLGRWAVRPVTHGCERRPVRATIGS